MMRDRIPTGPINTYDLIDDDHIKLLDLQVFCDNWLWQACYFSDDWYVMDMTISPNLGGSSSYGFGFSQSSAMQSRASISAFPKPHPQPIKITEAELWDLIHWLEEIRKTEKYAREIPEAEWQDFMKRVYLGFEYLEN